MKADRCSTGVRVDLPNDVSAEQRDFVASAGARMSLLSFSVKRICTLLCIPVKRSAGERWSASDWSTTRRGWLFSHQHKNARPLVPLTSLWLDTLVLRLMNEPQPTSRRTWFVIDELASLQRLPQLGFPLAKFILLCRHPCNSSRPPPPFSSHCRMRGRERPAEAVVIRSTRSELVVLGLLVCSVHASHATRDRPEHRTKKPMGRPCQGTWSRLVLKAHAAGDVRAVFVLPGNLVMVPRP
jgi:hypothetical protein